MTHLSRTYHALISRKKYEIFLGFYGIIYFVYNTREMEENSKKERDAGVKKRGAPKRPSVGSRKDAREMHNAVSGRAAMLLADYSAMVLKALSSSAVLEIAVAGDS